MELAIPKLRHGSFFAALLEPRRGIDRALWAVIMEAYVHVCQWRTIEGMLPVPGPWIYTASRTVLRKVL